MAKNFGLQMFLCSCLLVSLKIIICICNFEIQHYKKRSSLEFSDCSEMDDKYLKRLHVIFPDGEELEGVDAFIYVWNRTNGYQWLGRFISLPIVKHLAIFAYSILAFLLYWRFNLFRNI